VRFRIDFGRAVLAIALASALWIAVQNEQNPDRTDIPSFTIPVDVVSVPNGLIVVSEPPQVQVSVRIPSDSWRLLRPGSFRAVANATGATPGVNELPVMVEALEPQVRSVDPIPPRVNLVMEEVIERIVPVRVNISGNVPLGYAYDNPRVAPENVTVSGPSSAVQRVEAAVVDIRLDGVTVSLSGTYVPRTLDARGAEVRDVRMTPSTVNVDVPVQQQVAYKEIGVRPTIRGQVAAGYYLQPVEVEPSTVTVVGSPTTLANVNFIDTQPIDVGGLSSAGVRRVQLAPPQGISVLQTQPITVTLRVSPLSVAQTVRLAPTVQNLGASLQLASDLPQLDVTFVGPAPTLQGLTPRDFRVVLDLGGLGAGRHEVEPRVTVPPGFTLERVEPPRVAVVLRDAPTPVPTPTRAEPPPPQPTATPTP
jgi:YbbR domain-containing protein